MSDIDHAIYYLETVGLHLDADAVRAQRAELADARRLLDEARAQEPVAYAYQFCLEGEFDSFVDTVFREHRAICADAPFGMRGHDFSEEARTREIPLYAAPVPAQDAVPDVLTRATVYAHDIVTWLHRDHYADNTTFEPFGDLLGLLSQIDNMICGWKEPAQPAVPAIQPHHVGALHRAAENFRAHAMRIADADPMDYSVEFPSSDAESIDDLISMLAAAKEGKP